MLREFYSDVLVPPAVWDEVTQAGARPGAAEVRAARSEGWLQVRPLRLEALVARLKADLDNGEAEAIALAAELPHSLLLVDEAEGRQAALQLGLDFTGTLGLLLRAKRVGRINALKPVLDDLRQRHGFRLSQTVYQQVLRQANEPS